MSVVVTLFNGAPWIEACIASILEQDWPGQIEVVVVDDCSTDDSREVVRRLPDPRIRLVCVPDNQGVSAARNRGMTEARYDWIAFNDGDDVWLPDKLSRQIALLDRHPEAVGVVGGNGRLHADNRSQWEFRFGPLRWRPTDQPHLKNPPFFDPRYDGHAYIQSLVVAREAALQFQFPRALGLMQDQVFLATLGAHHKLVSVQEPVFLYRLGYSNTTAPGKMKAREFYANQAYLAALIEARAQGVEEPDAHAFLRDFQIDSRDVERFELAQGLRRVNTDWVNHGLGRALLSLLGMTVRRPIATSRYILNRVRHWSSR